MSDLKYAKLQNGSDVRGVAMPNDAGEEVNLTQDAVIAISKAFAIWLKKKLGKDCVRVAVGRDSRLTGPQIMEWTIKGVESEGAEATNFEMASTPCMFMSTVLGDKPYDGSIMITASHLPKQRNGMKFFTRDGGLEKSDIKSLIEIAETVADQTDKVADTVKAAKENFIDTYAAHLCDVIKKGVGKDKPLEGMHIVVDAGNGAGGFFESKVLKPLGANTSGSQFLEPDGSFPNHIPNPENADAAKAIVKATLDNKADLGIIFDTDVDRAGAVLSDGTELTRNALIAMMGAILLKEHPGCEIVTDSITSTGLAKFIGAHGGVHRRFKRGYKNVINEAIRLNKEGADCELAMETSGHGALKENYFLDDGAYLMVKLLIELGKGHDLKDMIKDLAEPAEAIEIRFTIDAGDVAAAQDAALKALDDAVSKTEGWSLAPDNFEGIRVNADKSHGNGWLLLRKSLHDPILPLNIESDEAGGCEKIAKTLYEIIKDVKGVNTTPLKEFVCKRS